MPFLLDAKQLYNLGYKTIWSSQKEIRYSRFGKVTINLTLTGDGKWYITHDSYFPDKDNINSKAKECINKNNMNNYYIIKYLTLWIDKFAEHEIGKLGQGTEEGEKEVNSLQFRTLHEQLHIPNVKSSKSKTLTIYVWGRSVRKKVPDYLKIQHNFNACVLHGKKAGVDWRKDGRQEEIRNAVMKGRLFPSFMETMVNVIERKDLHIIGINCSKGRHRSVTCAIMLKNHFYPDAVIHFLELK